MGVDSEDEAGGGGVQPGLQGPRPLAPGRRHLLRALAIVMLCLTAAMLLSVDAVYGLLKDLLAWAEPLIAGHPVLGPLAFIALSAVSAVLAFFSSALLVPPAVLAWGQVPTAGLLWLGWLLGGMLTYAVGRGLHHPGAPGESPPGRLAAHLPAAASDVGFVLVLLWQLALPSEIPGYLCGYLGIRFRTYVAALAVAELPYAIGAVALGESVVQREPGWLVGLGVLAASLGWLVARALRRRMHPPA